MSLRKNLIFGLLSFICFSLGVTATVLFSHNLTFKDALPHPPKVRTYHRDAEFGWRANRQYGRRPDDHIMAYTIQMLGNATDQQTLGKLEQRISSLESVGLPMLGIYTDYPGSNVIDYSESGTPAFSVFQHGDVITGIGNQPVNDLESLHFAMLNCDPNSSVVVSFSRDGVARRATVYPITRAIGQMPLSHRALCLAYISNGNMEAAERQFRSYSAESPYASDLDSIRSMLTMDYTR